VSVDSLFFQLFIFLKFTFFRFY